MNSAGTSVWQMFPPGLVVGLLVLLLIIVVLWVLLPFAIFGTKDVLRALLKEQRRTNELLARRSGTASRTTHDTETDHVIR